MGFFGAIKSVLSKYATFSGRARRSEYWFFVLFCILWGWIPIVNIILLLVFLIPSLAVAVRRLHDIGRSGWWLFINFIPILGSIVLLVFYCTDSEYGDNQYGPNPKRRGQAGSKSIDDVQYENLKSHAGSIHREEPMAFSDRTVYEEDNHDETVVKSAFQGSKYGSLMLDGKLYGLSLGRNIVGRYASTSPATIQIQTDDLYMSRQHCIIDVQSNSDGTLTTTLRNYKNKNRTIIDGQIVGNEVEVCLLDDCDITMGHTTVRYNKN